MRCCRPGGKCLAVLKERYGKFARTRRSGTDTKDAFLTPACRSGREPTGRQFGLKMLLRRLLIMELSLTPNPHSMMQRRAIEIFDFKQNRKTRRRKRDGSRVRRSLLADDLRFFLEKCACNQFNAALPQNGQTGSVTYFVCYYAGSSRVGCVHNLSYGVVVG